MNLSEKDRQWHENFHATAIRYGALITRNQSGYSLQRLDENQLSALSETLAEQKRQLHRDIAATLSSSLLSGRAPSFGLTTESRQEMMKPLSEFLNRLVDSLELSAVSPETLHEWLVAQSSSSPSSTEQHPTDSHSEGRGESVAASTEQQAELEERGSYDWMDKYVAAFCERLSDAGLAAINSGAVPTSLMKLLGRVAYNEIERRRGA